VATGRVAPTLAAGVQGRHHSLDESSAAPLYRRSPPVGLTQRFLSVFEVVGRLAMIAVALAGAVAGVTVCIRRDLETG
jgi:hypothetical protein